MRLISHAAVAASFFAQVKLVGIVGEDFPKKYVELYKKHGIDLEIIERCFERTAPAQTLARMIGDHLEMALSAHQDLTGLDDSACGCTQ